MIKPSAGDDIIRKAAYSRTPSRESVPIRDCAGMVLAEPVFADRDQPPFDRVAMDGVAVYLDVTAGGRAIGAGKKIGVLQAGAGAIHFTNSGSEGLANRDEGSEDVTDMIEVMTGAALPEPWNTVIPYENLDAAGETPDRISKDSLVRIKQGTKILPGQHIHRRASDYRQGQCLLNAGVRIAAPQVHILASVGASEVTVFRRPRIGIVSTGDELVEVGTLPLPHQIRRSNPLAIAAHLKIWGYTSDEIHMRDDEELLRHGIYEQLERSDILVVTGGVSRGIYDFIPSVLKDLGCKERFHGVDQKPGKPLWFGTGPRDQLVFGLPGNPVSALVCFRRYVLPFIPLLEGGHERFALRLPVEGNARNATAMGSRTTFLAARVENDGKGPTRLRLNEAQGSGNYFSLLPSDGLVELPPLSEIEGTDTLVAFYPWEPGW